MVGRKLKLSKYALSNVFCFLDIQKALECRRVSSLFDEACLIGLTIVSEHDLVDTIDRCAYVIQANFSKEHLKEHEELRQREMSINRELEKSLGEAVQTRSNLYKHYKEHARLLNPIFIITKPIFCSMVLRHSLPKLDQKFDWNRREDL